jgi:hypothetical protein
VPHASEEYLFNRLMFRTGQASEATHNRICSGQLIHTMHKRNGVSFKKIFLGGLCGLRLIDEK